MSGRGVMIVAALCVALSGCGQPSDQDGDQAAQVADHHESTGRKLGQSEFAWPEAIPGELGGEVYGDVCATCHDEGLDRAPHRSMLRLMSPDSIHNALSQGAMRPQAEGLSDEQMRAVAEFITSREIGQRVAQPLPVCTGEQARFDYDEPPVWQAWGLTLENTRMVSSQEAGLTKESARRLKLKWAVAYPDALRARSHPMLAAGAIYVGSHDGTVYALDRQTGCARWEFKAATEVRTGIVISDWTAGDETAKPVAYFGDLIGNIYALDAQTGALVWRDRPNDHPSTTLTGTPVLYEGRLYVPVSSLEEGVAADGGYPCCTFRGSIVAYDAANGTRVWQTYTIDAPPQVTGKNAAGTDKYGPSGVAIWNSPTIDSKRNRLYVATGDNYSTPATANSDAVMAFDLADGKVAWVYQATPDDAWNGACSTADAYNCPDEDGPDYDFGAPVIIVPAGGGKDYLLAGQKSGVVYALDADSGELAWQTKVGRGGIKAGVHFGMAAGNGRVYVPISDVPDGETYVHPASPGVYALDIASGEFLWRAPSPTDVCKGRESCYPGVSTAITATPEMVIAGALDGVVRIHDAADGQVIWEFDTARPFETLSGATGHGGGMSGGAAPVVHDGMLIVNSGYGFSGNMPGNVLLVFEAEPTQSE